MYSKANIITLCGVLATAMQDSTTLSRFFDDTIIRIGLSDFPFFYERTNVSLTDGTATYNFPSDALRIIHAIMEDASISIVTEQELDAYSQDWRAADEDEPIALTQDELNRQYTLFPTPATTSGAAGAAPYGEDYPTDALFLVYTQEKASNFLEYYALPIAFESLAYEFAYPSDHQDAEFAQSCAIIAQFLTSLMEMPDGSPA
jgi:hypothetical protein